MGNLNQIHDPVWGNVTGWLDSSDQIHNPAWENVIGVVDAYGFIRDSVGFTKVGPAPSGQMVSP